MNTSAQVHNEQVAKNRAKSQEINNFCKYLEHIHVGEVVIGKYCQ